MNQYFKQNLKLKILCWQYEEPRCGGLSQDRGHYHPGNQSIHPFYSIGSWPGLIIAAFLFKFFFMICFFYTCISGKREWWRNNKKVYMVITILSAAGKKGILKLVDLASLQYDNQVLWFFGYTQFDSYILLMNFF
jgi:hypothetical protein